MARDTSSDESPAPSAKGLKKSLRKAAAPQGMAATVDLFERGFGLLAGTTLLSIAFQAPGLWDSTGIDPKTEWLMTWSRKNGLPFIADGLLGPQSGLWVSIPALLGFLLCGFLLLGRSSGFVVAILLSVLGGYAWLGSHFAIPGVTEVFECGLFALVLTPPLTRASRVEPSVFMIWLARLAVARHLAIDGYVQWTSYGASDDIRAVVDGLVRQPMPSPVVAMLTHLSASQSELLGRVILGVDLMAPLLLFATRWLRIPAAFAAVAVLVLQAATGNEGAAGWSMALLCVLWLDDGLLARVGLGVERPSVEPSGARNLRDSVVLVLYLVSLAAGAIARPLPGSEDALVDLPTFVHDLARDVDRVPFAHWRWPERDPLERKTLVFEGTSAEAPTAKDVVWEEYRLACRAGDDTPCVRGPLPDILTSTILEHGESAWTQEPWIAWIVVRLLENRAEVRSLFDDAPFRTAAPQFVRVRRARMICDPVTGNWSREDLGEVLPPLSLGGPALAAVLLVTGDPRAPFDQKQLLIPYAAPIPLDPWADSRPKPEAPDAAGKPRRGARR